MAKRSASIKDVAAQSGVSIATVSNVLNNRCYVSEELRTRVYQAVKDLHYTVNPIARSMRSSRTYTIGVILLDINCIFFAPLLKGIQNITAKEGYSVITYDSNYDRELEEKYARSMVNNMVDGLILVGLSTTENRQFYRELQADAASRGLPIVSIENDLCDVGIDSVFVNNEEAAYSATNHLLELGCRKILHIKAPQTTDSANARCRGYRRALHEAGIPFDPTLEQQSGSFSAMSGYNAIQPLLREGVPFDGVFAANDQMAVGALRALRNARIRVPEEVRVVGFDNTFIASIVEPALTTINVPNYQMGVVAARQLLRRIQADQTPGRPMSIQLDYELVIRRSTMASAQTNWEMVYW